MIQNQVLVILTINIVIFHHIEPEKQNLHNYNTKTQLESIQFPLKIT